MEQTPVSVLIFEPDYSVTSTLDKSHLELNKTCRLCVFVPFFGTKRPSSVRLPSLPDDLLPSLLLGRSRIDRDGGETSGRTVGCEKVVNMEEGTFVHVLGPHCYLNIP